MGKSAYLAPGANLEFGPKVRQLWNTNLRKQANPCATQTNAGVKNLTQHKWKWTCVKGVYGSVVVSALGTGVFSS